MSDTPTTNTPYAIPGAQGLGEELDSPGQLPCLQAIAWVLSSSEFNPYQDSMTLEKLLNVLQKHHEKYFKGRTATRLLDLVRSDANRFGVLERSKVPYRKQERVYLLKHQDLIGTAHQRRMKDYAFILDKFYEICRLLPTVRGVTAITLEELVRIFEDNHPYGAHPLPKRGDLGRLLRNDEQQRFDYNPRTDLVVPRNPSSSG
eukprot:EG_transcript_15886